jgi:hypothetical protein
MVRDAWLPIGYSLPDGAKTRMVLQEGPGWQIVAIDGGGRALVVHAALGRRWVEAGLVDQGRLRAFSFGPLDLLEISFPTGAVVAAVDDCRSPVSKAEALAFAAALKATRAIDGASALRDSIYVAPLSRLLPIHALAPCTDDADVLGRWLTGGGAIPATSFRWLRQSLRWLQPHELEEVIVAAGLTVDAADRDDPAARMAGDADAGAPPAGSERKEPFALPGRPALAAFLREHVIDIVENRARYQALGIGFPSAIVLHGPPGCGKTFAVERLVEHLGWQSFHIDAGSVASPYIHETSRKVAEVFAAAAASAPSVLVIDEMEAFLAERDVGSGHHRVEEVAEFLRRIPEAAGRQVLIMAMTNRLDMIDPAILRRGRFDHIIEVGPASEQELDELLRTLLARLPTSADVDSAALAARLSARPLSDVTFVVREAARLAARSGVERISQGHLLAALDAAPARQAPERRIGFV